MPAAWPDALERQLLFGIIEASSSTNWDQVALAMGEGYTVSAVKQKFSKMKIKAKEEYGEMGDVPKGSAPKPKPKPKGSGTAKKAGGKRKGKTDSESEAADGDDDAESPSKKVKVKDEDEQANGVDEDEF